jgi:hypothetical protein
MKHFNIHDRYLDELCWRLPEIDENPYKVKWILKDGIWMPEDSVDRIELCDLVLAYYDGHGVPIELKGDHSKRNKAISQIQSGKRFIEDVLDMDCCYGKFVVYKNGKYIWERVDF